MVIKVNLESKSHLVLAGIFALGEPHDRLLSGNGDHEVGPSLATVPVVIETGVLYHPKKQFCL